jgi:glycosyltransferase involved in cell wall biosynthesis
MASVWPELQRAFPNLQLEVAGRNMPAWARQFNGPNARVLGEVEDARAFMARHTVLLAPILSGSGVRIKVIEGMAMGKVVLSTSIGMEGIPARAGQEVLVADTPTEFVAQLRYLYDHPEQVREIGRRARAFIGTHFDRDALAKKLLETIHSLPGQPSAKGYDGDLA